MRPFLYKSALHSFSLGFVIIWHKNMGAKAARIMLKLTTGQNHSGLNPINRTYFFEVILQ